MVSFKYPSPPLTASHLNDISQGGQSLVPDLSPAQLRDRLGSLRQSQALTSVSSVADFDLSSEEDRSSASELLDAPPEVAAAEKTESLATAMTLDDSW